ncbi:hypothetical protein PSEUDO8O_30874 [Pseudomonas sp. 8O]|nr:hypothetical protein PSEUDO8O_30874 [Pseudomonas sp. 8O]
MPLLLSDCIQNTWLGFYAGHDFAVNNFSGAVCRLGQILLKRPFDGVGSAGEEVWRDNCVQ